MGLATELKVFRHGKVRDVYDLGDHLLMVASDRISAFDYVLPTLIPDKGKVLNKISVFWFKQLEHVMANHLITAEINQYPVELNEFKHELEGRSMLVQKTNKLDVECIVRGYLSGSGWKEYQKTQSICGVALPAGLKESQQLPEPIFTPTTKEEGGKHDENITFEQFAQRLGEPLANTLRAKSIELYKEGWKIACSKGLILADTKFEFGMVGGQPLLIDEALTPDSSRFWDQQTYRVGFSQDSFDKQIVRNYLEQIGWNKQPPIPSLPDPLVEKTRQRYIDAFEKLTSESWR